MGRQRAARHLVWTGIRARNFRSRLLAWYKSERRDLPWRQDADPYRVWISEIMLQQTQVRTAVGYYHRFLARLPDLQSLADASEREVLSLWAGLGYYTRARNLRLAAQKIVREFGGKLPDRVEGLLQLPGIGRYTAGAIASIAFNRPEPIVDGNVKRVISRLHGVRAGTPESFFWAQAEGWLPRKHPSDFNQAVMELGALICTNRQPGCSRCPVAAMCAARKRGLQDRIPASRAARASRPMELVILLLECSGSLLVCKERSLRLIPGPYVLPTGILKNGDSPKEAAQALIRALVGFRSRIRPGIRIRHSITFHRLTAHVFHSNLDGYQELTTMRPGLRWIPRAKIGRFMTSALYRKALGSKPA